MANEVLLIFMCCGFIMFTVLLAYIIMELTIIKHEIFHIEKPILLEDSRNVVVKLDWGDEN